MIRLLLIILCLISTSIYAKQRIVNVYAWTSEIPESIVRQFEKETGIEVNFSTYENNEVMYAKLNAAKNIGYDVIMPSSYFVDRMQHQNILEKLDKTQIPNWKNLNPQFLHPAYDPNTDYSVPFIWGITGIFYNSEYFSGKSISKWSDLWDNRFHNQLMLLDDMREVFSMSLLSLGYTINDTDPDHIRAAFLHLQKLTQNIKVFSTETVTSIMIDEDATAGMGWNGDTFKAQQENSQVNFIFPQDGFVIWVDNLSIPKNAPHKKEAYAFINFLLRPDIAKAIALYTHFPITNLAGQQLLPKEIRNNPTIYPSPSVMKRGQFQTNLPDDILNLYEKYWEELKMSG
jgi:spermidine/putrescine transport system substrate-binding protein